METNDYIEEMKAKQCECGCHHPDALINIEFFPCCSMSGKKRSKEEQEFRDRMMENYQMQLNWMGNLIKSNDDTYMIYKVNLNYAEAQSINNAHKFIQINLLNVNPKDVVLEITENEKIRAYQLKQTVVMPIFG